jgi:hypothetical protein
VIAGIIQETPTPKGGRFYMHTTRFTTIPKPRSPNGCTTNEPADRPAQQRLDL